MKVVCIDNEGRNGLTLLRVYEASKADESWDKKPMLHLLNDQKEPIRSYAYRFLILHDNELPEENQASPVS